MMFLFFKKEKVFPTDKKKRLNNKCKLEPKKYSELIEFIKLEKIKQFQGID
jgi:hypothetical protein